MRIGIDLGGTKVEGIAIGADNDALARERLPTPRGDYSLTIQTLKHLVAYLETATGQTGTIGIGIPGALSPATGLVKNANSTWLIGKPLDKDLEQALGRPVRIANDADCFALSEASDGAGANAGTVFGVILGTGCGGGIVVDKKLVAGPNAIAGEWGHNALPWPTEKEYPGPECYCGRRGCIETWISGPGFARDFCEMSAAPSGPYLSAKEIMSHARAGDRLALAAFDRYQDRLARALAGVINILDPHVIVLGGGLSNIEEIYAGLPPRLGPYVFSDRVDTKIRPNRHGDSSGVRGAAWLWPAS